MRERERERERDAFKETQSGYKIYNLINIVKKNWAYEIIAPDIILIYFGALPYA
jgi:hypothetical protein